MKKSISMLLAASMVGTMLAGCGASAPSSSAATSSEASTSTAAAPESVTLKLATWDNTSNNVVTDAVASFEAANPNIKV